MSRAVFISYARSTSRPYAEALQREVGQEDCFLDTTDIAAGERFPETIAQALFASRVAVVFADAEYFRRWYCLWELETLLAPYTGARGATEAQQLQVLRPLVVALAPGGTAPTELQWLPPLLRVENRVPAEEPVRLAKEVRARLAEGPPTLQERLKAAGLDAPGLQRELVQRALLPSPVRLGIKVPVYPPASRRKPSLGDGFKGRAEDLWRLSFALSVRTTDGHSGAELTGALSGLGGAGKTTLAWEYVHRFGPRHYPGGIFWVDADVGDEALEAQHHGILQALRSGTPDLPTLRQQGVRIADVLAGALEETANRGRVLYVVDNVPEPQAGTPPRPLETWCPGLGLVSALFTSRLTLKGAGVVPLPVDVLSREAAIALLLDGVAGVDSTRPQWANVVEWVGRLPLALRLLNSVLLHQALTPAELWNLVEKGTTEVLEEHLEQVRPALPQGSHRGVVDAFRLSYERLSPEAQRAARLLAHLAPEPIPIALLEAFGLQLFSGAVRTELVSRSFVSPVSSGGKGVEYFGHMHRVLADFLRRQQVPGDTTLQEACAGMNRLLAAHDPYVSGKWAFIAACKPHAESLWASLSAQSAEHPDTPGAMNNLAHTLWAMGEWAQARQFQQQVLETCQRTLGEEHPGTLTAMNNLAHVLEDMGELPLARQYQQQVLESCRRTLGPEHPNTLRATNNLASILRGLGEWQLALQFQQQVLEAYQRTLGAENPGTLAAMNNLASMLKALGERAQALQLQQQVLEVSQRTLGAEHPNTLAAMNNLASTLWDMGERSQARQLQQQVLLASQRTLGAEHPDTLRAMNNLAHMLEAMGERPQARQFQQQVLEAYQRTLGVEHPNTLRAMNNLAHTLGSIGEWAQARQIQQQVLEACQRTLGAEHPDTLTAMNNLASTLGDMGERAQAWQFQQQVLDAYHRTLGAEHPDTLRAMNNLASTLRDMGEWAQAQQFQQQVLEARQRTLGAEHPDTLRAMNNLASTLWDMGERSQARQLQQQVVDASRRTLGAEHPETLRALNNLASTLWGMGEWAQARQLQQQVLETCQRILGAEHPGTLTAMENLAHMQED